MKALLDALRPLRIAVVGEAIRDHYVFVTPLGMSPKDALVTWRYGHEETYEGGATAVANHLRAFCDHVGEITQDIPLVKTRYVWEPFTHKVFAIETLALDASAPARLQRHLDVARYDVVIVADYGHGLLTDDVIARLTQEARFLAVMAQTNSANMGFHLATRYPRADYVCLDELELRLAMQDRHGPLDPLADKLREQMGARMIAVTLGHHGSLVVDALGHTRMPVVSREVVDRIGAGDAFLALTAPCVALGATREQVGRLGNAAGALAVRTVGNKTPITRATLEAMLR